MPNSILNASLGINLDRIDAVAEFPLGTPTIGDDNRIYTYVQAGGAIAADQTDITISAAFQATDDGSGTNRAPQTGVAIADNEYFWAGNATLLVDL